MTLMNAPEYDSRRDTRNRNLLIAAGVLVLLTIAIGMGGFVMGHGWFFSNLPAEHKVNNFFNALEAKDYAKALWDMVERSGVAAASAEVRLHTATVYGGLDDG